jgi:hypothetical protein
MTPNLSLKRIANCRPRDPGPVVLRTFSPPRAWRLAVVAGLAQTLRL